MNTPIVCFFLFFFNDTATTEIYTLSLHDALPISSLATNAYAPVWNPAGLGMLNGNEVAAQHLSYLESMHYEYLSFVHPFDKAQDSNTDRKSTRLNSSHQIISYAVFCLKKKKYIALARCGQRCWKKDWAHHGAGEPARADPGRYREPEWRLACRALSKPKSSGDMSWHAR